MTKQIELNLQKRLLIVEAPEGDLTACGNDDEVYYAIKRDETYIKIVDGKKWILVCKGSELTEEISKRLVHKSIHTGLFAHYVKDIPVNTYCYKSALDSFLSAIEAQGFIFGENPVSLEREKVYRQIGDEFKADGILRAWQEAESKTFNPSKTLIFEIL